jgi:hypothetical protein
MAAALITFRVIPDNAAGNRITRQIAGKMAVHSNQSQPLRKHDLKHGFVAEEAS